MRNPAKALLPDSAAILGACLALFCATPAWSQQDDDALDEALLGFDEPEQEEPTPAPSLPTKTWRDQLTWLDFGVTLSLGSSFNFAHDAPDANQTDYRGFSRLEPRLSLDVTINPFESWRLRIGRHFDYDFIYFIRGRDEYTDEVLDAYESEYEWWVGFDDLYVQGKILPMLDIKVGRQVVAWGKSENIRVTDILNPLDNREPGVVDIENLRLPVVMSKLDLYLGDWNISGIVGHEVRLNKDPTYGSDFYPSTQPPPEEEAPGWDIENQEYAVAVNGAFSGWDLSLYGASFFADQAHLEADRTPGAPPVQTLRHSRLTMSGAAFDVVLGNWLLKGEVAYLYGLEFFSAPGDRKSRLDVLAGVTYSGFDETVISVEIANRHLFAHEKALEDEPDSVVRDELQYALRITRELLHDRLLLMAFASTFGPLADRGALVRLNGSLECTDAVSLSAGVIFYRSGDKRCFIDVGDNDRIFVDLTYNL